MLFDNAMEFKDTPDFYNRLRQALAEADTVIIGAGAGLSASAGFAYAGERFKQFFLILKPNTAFGICTPADLLS